MDGALIVALVAVGLLAFLVWQTRRAGHESTMLLQQQITALRQQIDVSLGQLTGQMLGVNQAVGERLDHVSRAEGEVKLGLGELKQATERVLEMGKEIASLQEVLGAPKLRGGLGELLLTELLAQVLPAASFSTQHRFRSGEAVDAVIRLANGLVPVDAKFPLENFRRLRSESEDQVRARQQLLRDVRKHVDDIATKYIRPDEGTLPFARMYVPAEQVYYEVFLTETAQEIGAYAREKRVLPVSPNSLYAYLSAIAVGLRGLQIEEHAQAILARVQVLQARFDEFRNDVRVLGTHLGNARSKFDEVQARATEIGERLTGLTQQEHVEALPDPAPITK